MIWRGRRQSNNVKDRRGLPTDPAWKILDLRTWAAWLKSGLTREGLDPATDASIDKYVSRKDRADD